MASVNFEKIKSVQQMKACLRHCDKKERLEHEHSNKHIDKSRTSLNLQGGKYADTCKLVDDRMAYFDSLEGQNKRKDRVIGFGLCVPIPEGISDDKLEECSLKIINMIYAEKGERNFINAYLHVDETHEYKDAKTGENRQSLRHVHIYDFCTDENGRFNGKEFSSRKNMMKLNRDIHAMMLHDYGVNFMDGTQRKSKDTVEYLKNESERQKMRDEVRAEIRKDIEKEKPTLELRYKKRLKQQIKDEYEEKYKEELKTALKGKYEARIKQLEDELTNARDNYVDMYISLSDDKRDTVKHREMEDKYCDLYEQSQNVFDLDDEFEL